MGSVVHSVLYCQIVTDTVIMRTILAFILLVTASVVTQGRRTKSLHSKSGELSRSLHKEASNSVYHGPKYSSKAKDVDEKLARKKAKYYKKLLGHKGEHRAANTKHDHDDITLQDLSLTPVQTRKKPTDFNKIMKMESIKPSKKKMLKKLLAKE